MAHMYGILAVTGWAATVVVFILILMLPRTADQSDSQSKSAGFPAERQ